MVDSGIHGIDFWVANTDAQVSEQFCPEYHIAKQ
jgi:cell division GTPase FtsZ